jgi:hypothetical protein
MKNTLENKSKFFTQYWGQKVGREQTSVENDGFERNYVINHVTIQNIDYDYLELKSLSDMTDEDAIEVAKILFGDDYEEDKWVQDIKLNLRDQFGSNIFPNIQPYFSISWKVVDYLRSKGYASSWNGISVEEQIKFGWIKLKN